MARATTVAAMDPAGWLTDIRISYDTVAESYAALFSDGLARHPGVRGALAWFSELVRGVGGPVLDAGCGTGHVTGHLRDLGVEAFGIDLSPGMIDIARRDHPGLRFDVGSMTDLDLPDCCVGGVLAFYSVIHVPDEEIPAVLAGFHRILRPGGIVMLGFHVGDERRHKTQGYGGHPMNLYVHRRPVDRVAQWLRAAGFSIEANILVDLTPPVRQASSSPAGRHRLIRMSPRSGERVLSLLNV